MKYNIDELNTLIEQINSNLPQCRLPRWEQLPVIDLYMDQVIILIKEYLTIFNLSAVDEKSITPPMINNYVKLKIMPAPLKKKYSRIHLAYLIIICTLKQTMSMASIQKIIPCDIDEESVKSLYNSYVANQVKAFEYVKEQINQVAQPVLKQAHTNPERINDLIMQTAINTNILKILNDRLLSMNTEEIKTEQ